MELTTEDLCGMAANDVPEEPEERRLRLFVWGVMAFDALLLAGLVWWMHGPQIAAWWAGVVA